MKMILLGSAFVFLQATASAAILKARHSNKCIDISGASKELFAKVQQWECNGTGAQNFNIISKGAYFQIQNANSGLCLDAQGARLENGVPFIQFNCHGGDSQLFSREAKGDNFHYVKVKHSGKCMDVEGIGQEIGRVIQQWDCANGANQMFSFSGGGDVPPPVVPPPVTPPPPTTPPPTSVAGRGASLPYDEYQAEEGQTNAERLGDCRRKYDASCIQSEAVGRQAVKLNRTGDFVAWRAKRGFNSIVVRLSVPDSAGGWGADYKLGVYVNGQRIHSLDVTSRYSWNYNGEDIRTPNNPGGQPHVFFDEARALFGNYPAGAEIKLQRDGGDNAQFYVVDLIDLEQVEGPKGNPGLKSVTDFGAFPNDGRDDANAIQRAIDNTPSGGLYFPPGDYQINDRQTISLRGIQFRGAGMWHTRLRGRGASFYCWGTGGCQFSDFSVLGETSERNDSVPDNAFNGHMGNGSIIERVWIEHVKVGHWNGDEQPQAYSDGYIFRNNRVRNTWADGINLANGARNSIIENNHFRNTGDDAIAMWSARTAGKGPDANNVARNNTIQVPWRANCMAIYGGTSNRLENNLCMDVTTYAGIHLGFEDFGAIGNHPFQGHTVIDGATLIRAGGFMFGRAFGALRLNAAAGPMENITVQNVDVINPTTHGLEIDGQRGYNNVLLKDIRLEGGTVYHTGARPRMENVR